VGGLATSAGLLAMALVLFMAEFGNVVPAPVLPLFVPQLSGVPRVGGQPQTSTAVGIILAVAGVCAALSSWRVQRLSDRFGYRRVLVAAAALAGALYVPSFFVQSVWRAVAEVRVLPHAGTRRQAARPCRGCASSYRRWRRKSSAWSSVETGTSRMLPA
jgi:MFS family permease